MGGGLTFSSSLTFKFLSGQKTSRGAHEKGKRSKSLGHLGPHFSISFHGSENTDFGFMFNLPTGNSPLFGDETASN